MLSNRDGNRNRNRNHRRTNVSLQRWITQATLFVIGCCSLVNCAYGEMELLGTRISRYAVNSTIDTRFLSTIVTVDFVNSDNCSRVVGFSMQLPLNARVSRMNMNSSTDCTLDGEVKAEEEAKADFAEQASQGQSAALLQAYDSANYGVQVSIPPLGMTRLEIAFEELLRRANHQISFQVPVSPGVPVDQLIVDIAVNDPHSGVSKLVVVNETNKEEIIIEPPVFYDIPRPVVRPANLTVVAIDDDFEILGTNETEIEIIDDVEFIFDIIIGDNEHTGKYATAHYEATDVSKETSNRLPALVKAFYDTGPIPMEGILIPDTSGNCFTHLFNPGTMLEATKPLARNFVFVIDVSGSMYGDKLNDAKAAFQKIIQKLNNGVDHVAIHAFSNGGMESTWGPEKIDSENKEDAIAYVNGLSTVGGTNLNDAYVDGIKRAKEMQDESTKNTDELFVPIVIILTDGQASSGTTDSVMISKNVRAENGLVDAKIYAISFGRGADYNLLSGLSIQNNGIVVKIYEDYGDADTQIEEFYLKELGAVLMTDLSVVFSGSIQTQSQTRNKFPVFPDGSEITVRALTSSMHSPATTIATDAIGDNPNGYIQAVVTGKSRLGLNSWMSQWNYTSTTKPSNNQDCVKSFAHSKIEELIAFRDATNSLGSEMKDYAPASFYENEAYSGTIGDISNKNSVADEDTETAELLIKTAESKAIALALEAGIVWPGLTAMVTVENDSCAAEKANAILCVDEDGENKLAVDEEDNNYDDDNAVVNPFMSSTSSNTRPAVPQAQSATSSFSYAMSPSSSNSAFRGASLSATAVSSAMASNSSSPVIYSFQSDMPSDSPMMVDDETTTTLTDVAIASPSSSSLSSPLPSPSSSSSSSYWPSSSATVTGSDEEALAGSDEDALAGSDEDALAGSDEDTLAGSDEDTLESSTILMIESDFPSLAPMNDSDEESVEGVETSEDVGDEEKIEGLGDEGFPVETTEEVVVEEKNNENALDQNVVDNMKQEVDEVEEELNDIEIVNDLNTLEDRIINSNDSSSFSLWKNGTDRMIWCSMILLSTMIGGMMFGK